MKKAFSVICCLLCLSLFSGCKASNVSSTESNANTQPSTQNETKPNVTEATTSEAQYNWDLPSNVECIVAGKLPEGWSITFPKKNEGEIFKHGKQVGSIEILGYYGELSNLPNHSSVIRFEDVKSGLGDGKIYLLQRDMPAASKNPRTWNEYYAIFPIGRLNLAYSVQIETDALCNDLTAMKSFLLVLGFKNKDVLGNS